MKYNENDTSSKSKMIKEIGGWLDAYPWQWFLTLTFAKNVSPDTAKALFRQFIDDLGEEVTFFVVVEWHRFRDCVHIHSLVGKVDKEISWLHGMKKALPYDKSLGARYYVAKFISSPLADWDFKLNGAPDKKQMEGGQVTSMERKRLTVLKAVRHKCLYDCSCGQRSEVRNCVIPECTLFPYRFGKNPYRKGIGGKKNDVPPETAS